MLRPAPDLRRTWLFGPGADRVAHEAMLASGADALIFDLEDFTPPQLRAKARDMLATFIRGCRDGGCLAAIERDGPAVRLITRGGYD